MKKQTRWLLFTGTMLMAVPLFTKYFLTLSVTIADFIKGLGVGIIIAAFFLELKGRRKART
jgi:multisubunit Na+/H+ antiporter MnhE subunit